MDVIAPDGAKGYMDAAYLQYVRTETAAPIQSEATAITQTKDQLLPIYDVACHAGRRQV
jgi:hypothetical protein